MFGSAKAQGLIMKERTKYFKQGCAELGQATETHALVLWSHLGLKSKCLQEHFILQPFWLIYCVPVLGLKILNVLRG